jgi:hypothetical protein
MSAGMSQSVVLPPAMLEALGEYKDALKGVKAELKDLEKEARAIERKGGVVPREMREKIEGARERRNRLEDRIKEQKQERRDQQKYRQSMASMRRTFSDPFGTAFDTGIRKLERTRTGRALTQMAGRTTARVGAALGEKGIFGITRGAALTGGLAAAAAVKVGFDLAIERAEFRKRGAQGEAETMEVFTNLIRRETFGGSMANNFERVMAEAKRSGAESRKALEQSTGLYGQIRNLIVGGTQEGQDIEDRVAQRKARQAVMAAQYGHSYTDAIDWQKNKERYAVEYEDKMYENMGFIDSRANYIAEALGIRERGSGRFINLQGQLLKKITRGWYSGGDTVAAAEVKVREQMTAEKEQGWVKERQQLKTHWETNQTVGDALARSENHMMNRAINAFEADLQSRGLVWGQ